jgi:hypothetical protein
VIGSSKRPLPTQPTTNTREEHHTLSGIRTRVPSNQAAADDALDRTAAEIGCHVNIPLKFNNFFVWLRVEMNHSVYG